MPIVKKPKRFFPGQLDLRKILHGPDPYKTIMSIRDNYGNPGSIYKINWGGVENTFKAAQLSRQREQARIDAERKGQQVGNRK